MYLFAALFGWLYAAVRDVQVRNVPNYVFGILALLGVLRVFSEGLLIQAVVSLTVMIPLSLYAWKAFDFGGADAKAFIVASLLYPESIFVFLFAVGVSLICYPSRDEIPMLVPCFAGAVVTTAYLIAL